MPLAPAVLAWSPARSPVFLYRTDRALLIVDFILKTCTGRRRARMAAERGVKGDLRLAVAPHAWMEFTQTIIRQYNAEYTFMYECRSPD